MPTNDTQLETVATDDSLNEYLEVALATYHGGFSKGTANVGPKDITKLHGILDHYAKMPHPFTACVKDNRKRFGAKTEAYCAVLKDLIVGNTKWRNGGSHTSKGVKMSEESLREMYELEIPEGFYEWLEGDNVDLAVGDVIWNGASSWNAIRDQLSSQLNAGSEGQDYAEVGMGYWVNDVAGNEALVCAGGNDYYVVPFSVDKKGVVSLSDESEWKPVNQEWVETSVKFAQEQIGAEVYFTDSESSIEDGLVWKTILREGTFAMSPGPGQKPIAKPIQVVKEGPSNGRNLVISIDDVKKSFEAGAVEHVTIPTSHADSVLENTGFVKGLRTSVDAKGRTILEAGMEFTEPEIREKAMRGTIANVSAGVLFDYVNKESGRKYDAVIGHTALTNHPWLNDMKPFGILASEDVKILTFSEETEVTQGGDVMPEEAIVVEEPKAPKFLSDLGLSEEEAASRLAKYEELERRDRQHQIDAKVDSWVGEHKSPAVIEVAKSLLSEATPGDVVLNLSENGKTVGLSVEDIVERFMAATPALSLATDPISTEQLADGEVPVDNADAENDAANLSQEVRTLAAQLYFEESLSSDEALAEAKRRVVKSD